MNQAGTLRCLFHTRRRAPQFQSYRPGLVVRSGPLPAPLKSTDAFNRPSRTPPRIVRMETTALAPCQFAPLSRPFTISPAFRCVGVKVRAIGRPRSSPHTHRTTPNPAPDSPVFQPLHSAARTVSRTSRIVSLRSSGAETGETGKLAPSLRSRIVVSTASFVSLPLLETARPHSPDQIQSDTSTAGSASGYVASSPLPFAALALALRLAVEESDPPGRALSRPAHFFAKFSGPFDSAVRPRSVALT